MLGTRVDGKYELAKEMGQGAMGVVYRATHATTGREVALKLLHPGKALAPQALERAAVHVTQPLSALPASVLASANTATGTSGGVAATPPSALPTQPSVGVVPSGARAAGLPWMIGVGVLLSLGVGAYFAFGRGSVTAPMGSTSGPSSTSTAPLPGDSGASVAAPVTAGSSVTNPGADTPPPAVGTASSAASAKPRPSASPGPVKNSGDPFKGSRTGQ